MPTSKAETRAAQHAPTDADRDDMPVHFWRECPKCGYCGGGYLHCAHDGYQNPCHHCGAMMPTLKPEEDVCDCKFVATVEEICEITAAVRAEQRERDAQECDGFVGLLVKELAARIRAQRDQP